MAVISTILFILGLGAFLAMSRPFKFFALGVPAAIGFFLILSKSRSPILKAFDHISLPDFINPLKMVFTLPSIYIGIVVIGAILGLMRESASDSETYKTNRKRFLFWLLKWGSAFAVFREILGLSISFLFYNGDTDTGWLLTRVATVPVLVAFVVFLAIANPIFERFSKNGNRPIKHKRLSQKNS